MDYEPLTASHERGYAQLEQRRLREINAALLAALEGCVADLAEWRMFAAEEREKGSGLLTLDAETDTIKVLEAARAAIRNAKGGQ